MITSVLDEPTAWDSARHPLPTYAVSFAITYAKASVIKKATATREASAFATNYTKASLVKKVMADESVGKQGQADGLTKACPEI